MEQGGDIEHADEESDGDGVHLSEEEDEGGGEGAGQGEQQELLGDDQDGCSIRIIRNCECSGIYLPMSLKSAANTLMSEVTYKRTLYLLWFLQSTVTFPYHLPAGGFGLDEGGHQVIVSQGEENPERRPSQEERQHCTDLSLYCGLCFIFIHTIQTPLLLSEYPLLTLLYISKEVVSSGFFLKHLQLGKFNLNLQFTFTYFIVFLFILPF